MLIIVLPPTLGQPPVISPPSLGNLFCLHLPSPYPGTIHANVNSAQWIKSYALFMWIIFSFPFLSFFGLNPFQPSPKPNIIGPFRLIKVRPSHLVWPSLTRTLYLGTQTHEKLKKLNLFIPIYSKSQHLVVKPSKYLNHSKPTK